MNVHCDEVVVSNFFEGARIMCKCKLFASVGSTLSDFAEVPSGQCMHSIVVDNILSVVFRGSEREWLCIMDMFPAMAR